MDRNTSPHGRSTPPTVFILAMADEEEARAWDAHPNVTEYAPKREQDDES